MQSFTQDDFGHLEGASGYSVDFDDASSLHSSVLSAQQPRAGSSGAHAHHAGDEHLSAEDAAAIQRIDELHFDDLSISGLDGVAAGGVGGDQGGASVANLYEDDFEGMLDDLNRELPPHACRCADTPPSSYRARCGTC